MGISNRDIKTFLKSIAAPVSPTASLFSRQLWVLRPSCQSALAAVWQTGAAGGARPSGCIQPQIFDILVCGQAR